MKPTIPDIPFILEQLLDSNQATVSSLLDDLIGICNAKAAHVRETYQDERLAKAWEAYARRLSAALNKIELMELKP